eukprot:g39205.t1
MKFSCLMLALKSLDLKNINYGSLLSLDIASPSIMISGLSIHWNSVSDVILPVDLKDAAKAAVMAALSKAYIKAAQEQGLRELMRMAETKPNGLEEKKVPLCCYPFIFNLNAKIQILHMNSVLEKTKAFVEAMNFTCRNICMGNPEHPKYPIFKLNVNRQDLVTDTFKKLIQVDEEDLR